MEAHGLETTGSGQGLSGYYPSGEVLQEMCSATPKTVEPETAKAALRQKTKKLYI